MSHRTPLFNRRASTTFEVEHEGIRFVVTAGEFPDGKPGEAFIGMDVKNTSTPLETLARDAGLILSLAIQYGASIDTLRRAVTRLEMTDAAEQALGNYGRPASLVGAVLDAIEGRKP